MRAFAWRELREALAYAAAGGQALHLHRLGVTPRAPRRFREAFAAGRPVAHLFDHDADRLLATARALGVRRAEVERAGTAYQHADLCGGPLDAALRRCAEDGARESAGAARAEAPSRILPMFLDLFGEDHEGENNE